MKAGYFISGTDTGVGKTVVTGGLLGVLRKRGHSAIALKPVQSGAVRRGDTLVPEDAAFYRSTANLPYTMDDLNLYRFIPPVSPGLAARMSGITVDPDLIENFVNKAATNHEIVLVEGAGGLCVPLVDNQFTMADLALLLEMPLVIVARPNLGTINHTVLTVSYARQRGIPVKGIIINGFRPESATEDEKTNPAVIEEMTGVPVLGIIPYLSEVNVEKETSGNLVDVIEKTVRWQELLPTGGLGL